MEIVIPKRLTRREKEALRYVVALLSTDKYFVRYYDLLGGDVTTVEAFYQLENELEQLCGVNRYSDYESFRQMRRRYVKRLGLRSKM